MYGGEAERKSSISKPVWKEIPSTYYVTFNKAIHVYIYHMIYSTHYVTFNKAIHVYIYHMIYLITCLNNTCKWFYKSPCNDTRRFLKTLYKLKLSYCWRPKTVIQPIICFSSSQTSLYGTQAKAFIQKRKNKNSNKLTKRTAAITNAPKPTKMAHLPSPEINSHIRRRAKTAVIGFAGADFVLLSTLPSSSSSSPRLHQLPPGKTKPTRVSTTSLTLNSLFFDVEKRISKRRRFGGLVLRDLMGNGNWFLVIGEGKVSEGRLEQEMAIEV